LKEKKYLSKRADKLLDLCSMLLSKNPKVIIKVGKDIKKRLILNKLTNNKRCIFCDVETLSDSYICLKCLDDFDINKLEVLYE